MMMMVVIVVVVVSLAVSRAIGDSWLLLLLARVLLTAIAFGDGISVQRCIVAAVAVAVAVHLSKVW